MIESVLSAFLVVHWRNDFAFYDRRTAVLGVLRDEGALEAWKVNDDLVGARMVAAHELLVQSNALSLACFTGRIDDHVLRHAMSAVQALDPRIEGATLSFPVLVPMEVTDLDEGVARAASAVLGPLAKGLNVDDFSLLMSADSHFPGWTYKLEIAVVDPDEACLRAERRLGALAEADPPHTQPDDAAERPPFPDVGLFLECQWHTHDLPTAEADLGDWAVDVVRTAFEHTAEVVGTCLDAIGVPRTGALSSPGLGAAS